MCGIFFSFSTKKESLNKIKSKTESIQFTIEPRGPDRINVVEGHDFFTIHSQLIITGDKTQPVVTDKYILLFNGEIYNDYTEYKSDSLYSDTDYLEETYQEYGIKCFEKFDGEFAICIYDLETKTILLVTDTFGTKPLYYAILDDTILVGTYDSTIKSTGLNGTIHQVPANTLIVIDVSEKKINNQRELRTFDFDNQSVDSYSKWNNAFTDSMIKRTENTNHKYFISFSSGLDSGLIVAEMFHIRKKFKGYTVPYLEEKKILDERMDIFRENNISYDEINITEDSYESMRNYLYDMLEYYHLQPKEFDYQNFPDPDFRNIPGYVAAAIINKKARQDGNIISLSGQGADEIISDYSTGSMKMSELKGNWYGISKPWKNFFGGWNRIFLGGIERISGLFGIETRYPFLDYDLVQEFINLHPSLKSGELKPPIANKLRVFDFPLHLRKQGFAGYPAKGATYKPQKYGYKKNYL